MDPDKEDLFNDPDDNLDQGNDDNQEIDHLAELVGEGKKFSDVNALAKGKHESDVFIARLQKEAAELRKELNTRVSMEEFLEKTKNREPANGNPPAPKPDEQGNRGGQVSNEDIKTLIKETLTEEQRKSIVTNNLSSVKTALKNAWGRDYSLKLQEKASELGVGEEYLNRMAGEHPHAFLELVGVKISKVQESYIAPPVSDTRRPSPDAGRKNFASYEKLRKENPTLYFTPRVQNEMFEQAKKQGEDFYR